ncbi:MAG: PHP domain-containing protein [Gammaproteobacteria bacterium]|jgi:predicted metal-dependent phosphoesterase TrpH|nr:PHP domain-containing protein [Gammaproteobacteria bacterium]
MLTPDNFFKRADCHCHTTFSDGSFDVVALLDLAKEKQLSGLSITDHDTIDSYPIAIPYARTLDIELISGIEISTELKSTSIHVLGYAFDLQNNELISFCQRLQQEREQRNQKILEKLTKCKMPITMEELRERFGNVSIGRPHIAKLMVTKGYAKSMKQAFSRYLGDKCRCYVSGYQVEVEAAIELIHRASGYAVLAHPNTIRPTRLIDDLMNMPFDGIEVYYGHLSLKQEQPWIDIAMKKDWMMTGGSDFHGEKKSFHPLGCSWTPEDTFSIFSKRFAEH